MARRIALVGYMGAGKSTIGARLAERLGLSFVDLDRRIEERHGPIRALFAAGEGRFRALEASLLEEVLRGGPCVLAPGGGAPCQPGAMDRLRGWGRVVWLRVPLPVLAARVAGSGRPLADGDFAARYGRRRSCYGRAHHVVDADAPVEEVVRRVLAALESRSRG